MSGALNGCSVGRWTVALTATVAFMVGGGYLGSVGSAQAGDEPGNNNVGSPGRDGQGVTVTCDAHTSPRNASICNAVGGDGEDGAPGAVYR